MERLTSLQSLNLSECYCLSGDLAPLASLTSLQSLDISGCYPLSGEGDLSPLAGLTSLQSLELSWCTRSENSLLWSHSCHNCKNFIHTDANSTTSHPRFADKRFIKTSFARSELLDFLIHNGVLFYRPRLFGDRIVLDQNWATEAIYALLDRKKILPLLRL